MRLHQSKSFGGTDLSKKLHGKLKRICRIDIHISFDLEKLQTKVQIIFLELFKLGVACWLLHVFVRCLNMMLPPLTSRISLI